MMLKRTGSTIKMQSRHFLCAIGLSLASVIPTGANAEILWTGDFETGHLLQWHHPTNKIEAWYWGIPPYGRPARHPSETSSLSASYYGDGSLAAIVTSPVRQGRYAAKFTVKNSANGVEPADCDVGSCERRRAELWANKTLSDSYNAVPYMKERWISASVFVPADRLPDEAEKRIGDQSHNRYRAEKSWMGGHPPLGCEARSGTQ
jgi:hypothetical protein